MKWWKWNLKKKKKHHTNSQTPARRAPRRIWQHSLLDFEYLWTPRPTTSCLGREKVAKFRGEVFRSETDETAWHSVCTMWALCRTDLPQSRTKSLAHDLNESTDPDVFFRIPAPPELQGECTSMYQPRDFTSMVVQSRAHLDFTVVKWEKSKCSATTIECISW